MWAASGKQKKSSTAKKVSKKPQKSEIKEQKYLKKP